VASARDVSIVIPTWNGRHLLERFLPSVIAAASEYAQTTAASVEVVVVDDGSTDDSPSWLAERATTSPLPIRAVRQDRNLGFGMACNRGVAEARHPLVLLLNNDVQIHAKTIAPLVARFDRAGASDPLFAVHCRVLDFDSHDQVGTGKVGGFRRGFIRVHRSYVTSGPAIGALPSMFASGGSSMFDRARFLDLGGFDPLFAPFYFEDVELSYRAWKRGLTVGYEPGSAAWHRFSSTMGARASSEIRRVSQRNRLFLNWIHLHDRSWFTQHLLWVSLLLVTTPLTLRLDFARAVIDALGRLPDVRARRREEQARASRTDRDVIEIFRTLERRDDVRIYDRRS